MTKWKLSIFFMLITFLMNGQTCDKLILTDGTEIQAKVEEIRLDEIVYRKCENPEGPMYILEKEAVFMIKSANEESKMVKKVLRYSNTPESIKKDIIFKSECLMSELKDGTSRQGKILAFQKAKVILRPCDDGLGFGMAYVELKKIEGKYFVTRCAFRKKREVVHGIV